MKIGYLGPIGSYSYEAASRYKKDVDNIVEYATISNIFNALEENEIEIGILPFENAIYGSVVDTIDGVLEYRNLSINDEIIIDINHMLMAKNKEAKIEKIYSHPQAIAQCRKYLDKHFPNVQVINVSSTSMGASLAATEENSACICNIACKDLYNLEIISENIQEIEKNQTRFIVVSKNKIIKKNATKTSIIFETKNKPGALYKILGLFSLTDINLTKIESRPTRTKLGDYMFFVDIEGSIETENIKKVLEFVEEYCLDFRILGSY